MNLERVKYALKLLDAMYLIGMIDYAWTWHKAKRTSLVIKTRALINHDRILNEQETIL